MYNLARAVSDLDTSADLRAGTSDPGTASILVSAVVLTFQRQDLLPACLDSIGDALAEVSGPTEIVVVDNGSPGNAATPSIAQTCAEARIVTLPTNRGYAGGLNAGLEVAAGEWILTIGDDATVERGAISAMVSAGSTAGDVGSVAAKMVFADRSRGGVINSAGLEIDRLGIAIDRLLGAPEDAGETETTEVFGTSGGGALYRRAMLEDVGGFDATFGIYLEDADLAWRARIGGWRCLYEPAAVVVHHHSATTHHRSDYKYFHVGRNRVRMLAKNATPRHLLRYAPLILLYDLLYVAYALAVDRSTAPLRGRLQGLRESMPYRSAPGTRRDVDLAPVRGLRAALGRNAAVWTHGSQRSS
jgi:GT2 family glycosyltransferase